VNVTVAMSAAWYEQSIAHQRSMRILHMWNMRALEEWRVALAGYAR
jgi:hypothetical protein